VPALPPGARAGYAVVDANRRLAQAAAGLMEDGQLVDSGLTALAQTLGVTDRHLRRVFQQEFGVSPVEYAQTQRLLLAKRLLTDTDLPVIDVAMASGFASLRRFNDLFRTRYRMTPASCADGAGPRARDRLTFDLAYRPPYDWAAMLAFLEQARDPRRGERSMRAATGGRCASSGRARRMRDGSRSRSHARARRCASSVSASLAGALPAVLARVKQLFDLACHPDEIAAALGSSPRRARACAFPAPSTASRSRCARCSASR
jgi:AraC family transcriptional regulator of adaptative response / DNA-3-methyladenine glycosylase II